MIPLPRTPSFRLDGRLALVTGAGRGIGLALAAALAEAGAAVTLVARSAGEIEAAAEAIRAAGGAAEAASLDVSDLMAVEAFFTARPAFHALVNNAGTNRPKPMWEVSEADYDAVLDLNLKAAFFVAQHGAKRMIADGAAGSLIHIGSQMGHVGGPDRAVYAASKHAVIGLMRTVAKEAAPRRIRVNVVAPGLVETDMGVRLARSFTGRRDMEDLRSLDASSPFGRVCQPLDVANVVLWLCSPGSGYVTGQRIECNGGGS